MIRQLLVCDPLAYVYENDQKINSSRLKNVLFLFLPRNPGIQPAVTRDCNNRPFQNFEIY